MLIGFGRSSLRVGAWFCILLLAYLSLIPGDFQVRTGAPTQLEHFVAYLGTTMLFMLGYPRKRAIAAVSLIAYACFLEFCQTLSPGRFASVIDASASILGVGAAAALSFLISLSLLSSGPSFPGERQDLTNSSVEEQGNHSQRLS